METKILLLSTDKFDRAILDVMDGCFNIEEDIKSFLLNEEPKCLDGCFDDSDAFQLLSLDEFADICNNQLIYLDAWWMIHINLLTN